MKLEDQLTNLELSKRLKELGVNKECLFWWFRHGNPQFNQPYQWTLGNELKGKSLQNCEHLAEAISAFTVAELGEMLPKKLDTEEDLVFGLTADYAWCSYRRNWVHQLPELEGKTEADARAKMLIYLLKNKLVKP